MKCLILAAGYATRLYPLTENFPKPLLKVGEKTILDWLIDDIDAAGLGDIGRHFPDTDPQYKGADSRVLLRHVVKLVRENGYFISNVDVTMIAQKPKLKDHIPQMVENIAAAVGIAPGRVNVKATTEEKLGFTGEGLGMSCHAVCLLDE